VNDLPPPSRWKDWLAALGLVVAAATVYWPTLGFEFTNYDDPAYVTQNIKVLQGLTPENAAWAMASTEQSNWHPLTWLSHMLDVQVFGLLPGFHHLTNLLLHAANSVLVFLVLKRLTGARWPSALVAALFAIHPLHVESVAWISERKDVLSTLFWLLAMGAYALYAARPGVLRYLAVFLLMALGLMAKPMLVTLPFVLLLLDVWPLGRLRQGQPVRWVLLEKAPLLVLSAASCVVTYIAQQRGGSVVGAEILPLPLRLSNAVVAYVAYLWKMVWPADLAVLYPYPAGFPAWEVAGAAAAILAVSVLAIWQARRRPYLAVGWFWYLGALVPVIGLVQVGEQAMADRYTYVPLIGIFIVIAWGAAEVASAWPRRRWIIATLAALALAGLGWQAARQVACWSDSETLFRHALAAGADTAMAHCKLADAERESGDTREAEREYRNALAIDANHTLTLNNYGALLTDRGQYAAALPLLERAVERQPNYGMAQNNLGLVLVHLGRPAEALDHCRLAAALNLSDANAHNNLALAFATLNRYSEALPEARTAVELNPQMAAARVNLGGILVALGHGAEGIAELRQALSLAPDNAAAHYNLGLALHAAGDLPQAVLEFQEAVRINPLNASAHASLAGALAALGRMDAALPHAREALRLGVQPPETLSQLALALLRSPAASPGSKAEVVAIARQAADLADAQGRRDLAAKIQEHLKGYEAGRKLP
jgi:protein O-mannosyl-transferase